MTSEIIYAGNLRTHCTHLKSGNTIVTDAPTDNNGKGEAFSPTDLVATALGSCMLTIMGIVALRHNIALEGTKAKVLKIMKDNPRVIKSIEITFIMTKNYLFSDKDKQILQNAAHTCPVALSLHSDIEKKITFIW